MRVEPRTNMASSLSSEFGKFSKLTKQLRQILRDTQRCFHDINASSAVSNGCGVTAELTPEEEEEIAAIIKKPPCLVVLGQSCYCKSFLVNEIFGKAILPPLDYHEEEVRWRGVRFKYGDKENVSLSLPGSYELVESLAAYRQPWQTIPAEDLQIDADESDDSAHGSAILEVRQCVSMLKDGGQILVTSSHDSKDIACVYERSCEEVVPVFLYPFTGDTFSEQECEQLTSLKQCAPHIAMFFIRIPPPLPNNIAPSLVNNRQGGAPIRALQEALERHRIPKDKSSSPKGSPRRPSTPSPCAVKLLQQLVDLDYITMSPLTDKTKTQEGPIESELIDNFEDFKHISKFTRRVLINHLVKTTSLLNLVHTRCLQMFIYTAFDMQRDMMITPRRLEFAKEKETELYASLMDIALKKQDEIRHMISETISDMRGDLLNKAADYEFKHVEIPEYGEAISARMLKSCTGEIQELVLTSLNSQIAVKLIGSVAILKDSYTGVLTRCLESLERYDKENMEQIRTSLALREILNAAYQVEITVRAGSSLLRVLLEKMKQLIQGMPGTTPPKISPEWKRKVASDMLSSLSEARLAKSICSQIKERLKHSHESFNIALSNLNEKHTGRLQRTEEQRLRVRKVHAPKVARLALESTSLRDYILYGMPQMGREVGRGQYGVVYSCDTWAGYSPCAIKSVVPPDDKHWNDLALEFYYTKNVPQHERVVALRGSVIDYSYGGGSSPAVLLVMDRLQKDLYTAIKSGLDWLSRLQVAIDVIEGIRFLHSQGLVHRDIKLKNVLLDKTNRGRITDLGFCKPEAMMSGSIVGTPIHMAPELFTGKYDNSVDVYAFGILFWYVCAGHVRLPLNFEQCTSKDMLWTAVRRGIRPEKLVQFDEECWKLMKSCWAGDPINRPLLGNVQPQLMKIWDRYRRSASRARSPRREKDRNDDDF